MEIRIAEAPEGTSQVLIVAAPSYLTERGTPRAPNDSMDRRCVGIGAPSPDITNRRSVTKPWQSRLCFWSIRRRVFAQRPSPA
jgi:hypothetical protein